MVLAVDRQSSEVPLPQQPGSILLITFLVITLLATAITGSLGCAHVVKIQTMTSITFLILAAILLIVLACIFRKKQCNDTLVTNAPAAIQDNAPPPAIPQPLALPQQPAVAVVHPPQQPPSPLALIKERALRENLSSKELMKLLIEFYLSENFERLEQEQQLDIYGEIQRTVHVLDSSYLAQFILEYHHKGEKRLLIGNRLGILGEERGFSLLLNFLVKSREWDVKEALIAALKIKNTPIFSSILHNTTPLYVLYLDDFNQYLNAKIKRNDHVSPQYYGIIPEKNPFIESFPEPQNWNELSREYSNFFDWFEDEISEARAEVARKLADKADAHRQNVLASLMT